MSYTPPEQRLSEPIRDLLDAMENPVERIEAVINARLRSQEWRSEHIRELKELRHRIRDLQTDLEVMAQSTR